jgi:hypothetical protein
MAAVAKASMPGSPVFLSGQRKNTSISRDFQAAYLWQNLNMIADTWQHGSVSKRG